MQRAGTSSPTHTQITKFLQSLLPPKRTDVPFIYHSPRSTHYDPATATTDRIILSITPTPRVYNAINNPGGRPAPLCFLHRPFDLDRRAVRPGTLILASHTTFDEVLTVGWNVALAARLDMEILQCICIQGYKGDPDRKIGIVGSIREISLRALVDKIRDQFGGIGDLYSAGNGAEENMVSVLAIMNAFHATEVERVIQIAQAQHWIGTREPESERAKGILYLTGAPREAGIEAAQNAGVHVLCVGHRACEEWGIRYLGNVLRERSPSLQVEEIYEEEVLKPTKRRKDPALALPHNAEPPTAERLGV